MKKKINPLFMSLVALAMLQSCGCSDDRAEANKNQQAAVPNGYPENPANGAVYIDNSGNRNMWDAVLGAWVISSMMNGRSVNHYYYPSSGTYRDYSGRTVSRPSHIPAYRVATPSRKFGGSSWGTSSTGSSSKSASAPRSAGFGSTGKGTSAS